MTRNGIAEIQILGPVSSVLNVSTNDAEWASIRREWRGIGARHFVHLCHVDGNI